jgi:hypothetical protein
MAEPQIPTHIEFESRDQLVHALSQDNGSSVWRGQANYDWPLMTSLGRRLRAFDAQHTKDWIQLENSTIL